MSLKSTQGLIFLIAKYFNECPMKGYRQKLIVVTTLCLPVSYLNLNLIKQIYAWLLVLISAKLISCTKTPPT